MDTTPRPLRPAITLGLSPKRRLRPASKRCGPDSTSRGGRLRSLGKTSSSAVQGFQRATEQLTQITGPEPQDLARQSSENIGAVSQASTVLASGLQEASREWFGLAREQLAKNIKAFGRLAHCRSPQDLIAVQSELARDNIQQAIETSRRVGQVSLRIAQEAAGILQTEARPNASTDRIRRAA